MVIAYECFSGVTIVWYIHSLSPNTESVDHPRVSTTQQQPSKQVLKIYMFVDLSVAKVEGGAGGWHERQRGKRMRVASVGAHDGAEKKKKPAEIRRKREGLRNEKHNV